MQIPQAIELLNHSKDHKVLSRLYINDITLHQPKGDTQTVCVLDLETTGLDANQCEIIELGAVKADINEDGHIIKLYEPLSLFNQPKTPITEEITGITGITNEMVQGHTLDLDAVSSYCQDVDWMIAHNAGFDRRFAEKYMELFERKQWLCSAREPDWISEGFESFKLEYLNFKYLRFYDGHRATMDCYATLYILNQPSSKGGSMLNKGLKAAQQTDIELFAVGSPFESKDTLKSRGYRWNDGSTEKPKSWSYKGSKSEVLNEISFLNNTIYRMPKTRFEIMEGSAFNRHSDRIGQFKSVSTNLTE